MQTQMFAAGCTRNVLLRYKITSAIEKNQNEK